MNAENRFGAAGMQPLSEVVKSGFAIHSLEISGRHLLGGLEASFGVTLMDAIALYFADCRYLAMVFAVSWKHCAFGLSLMC